MKAEMAARGERYEPGAFPNDWASIQRAYPYSRINFEQLKEARAEARVMEMETAGGRGGVWVERGPTNIGARVTDLDVHPTSTNIVYAAMASGGVFKSTNGGINWTPIFDEQSVLSIGDLAIDPNDANTIYVGTGEANSSSFSWFGEGVYRSTDAGANWSYIGLEETRYIGRVIVDPNDSDRIWVAGAGSLFGPDANRGVYRSLDAGDTWEKVLALTDSTSAIDLAIHPTNTDTIYAAMWERMRGLTYRRSGGPSSGLYRSYDGGDTWTELTNGLPSGPAVGRIGVSVAESSPNIVYAFYCDDPGYFYGVYKSTDWGDTWNPTNDDALSNLTSSFGWYFGQIRVDPSDHTRAFVMGVPFYRTENGGFSWQEVGSTNHVDHHAMAFDPWTPVPHLQRKRRRHLRDEQLRRQLDEALRPADEPVLRHRDRPSESPPPLRRHAGQRDASHGQRRSRRLGEHLRWRRLLRSRGPHRLQHDLLRVPERQRLQVRPTSATTGAGLCPA